MSELLRFTLDSETVKAHLKKADQAQAGAESVMAEIVQMQSNYRQEEDAFQSQLEELNTAAEALQALQRSSNLSLSPLPRYDESLKPALERLSIYRGQLWSMPAAVHRLIIYIMNPPAQPSPEVTKLFGRINSAANKVRSDFRNYDTFFVSSDEHIPRSIIQNPDLLFKNVPAPSPKRQKTDTGTDPQVTTPWKHDHVEMPDQFELRRAVTAEYCFLAQGLYIQPGVAAKNRPKPYLLANLRTLHDEVIKTGSTGSKVIRAELARLRFDEEIESWKAAYEWMTQGTGAEAEAIDPK